MNSFNFNQKSTNKKITKNDLYADIIPTKNDLFADIIPIVKPEPDNDYDQELLARKPIWKYKDIFVFPSNWYGDSWDNNLTSFGYLKGNTVLKITIKLVCFIAVWIALSWFVGLSPRKEWLIYISLSIWLLFLTLNILPSMSQIQSIYILFIPTSTLIFIINYGYVLRFENSLVKTLVCIITLTLLSGYLILLCSCIITLHKELKQKIDDIKIISSYLFFISLAFRVLLHIKIIDNHFLFYLPSCLTVIFIFSHAIKSIISNGLIFNINRFRFYRSDEFEDQGIIGEFLNSFIRIINEAIIPLLEFFLHIIKVSITYSISTVLYFFIHFFAVLSNTLIVLTRFIRFFMIPLFISLIITNLCVKTSHHLSMYIHNYKIYMYATNNLFFLIYVFISVLLVPLCASTLYKFSDIIQSIIPFIVKALLPHIWISLLLVYISIILVFILTFKPYSFGFLSFCSVILWIIGSSIFIVKLRYTKIRTSKYSSKWSKLTLILTGVNILGSETCMYLGGSMLT